MEALAFFGTMFAKAMSILLVICVVLFVSIKTLFMSAGIGERYGGWAGFVTGVVILTAILAAISTAVKYLGTGN